MWRRGRTWLTLALLVLLNMVAWDIRTTPQQHPSVIPLYQSLKDGVTQYTDLKPDAFYFGSVWYSYAVAVFIGFVLPFILAPLLPWLWHRRKSFARGIWRLFDTRKKRAVAFWLVVLAACNVLAWDVMTFSYENDFGIPLYKSFTSYGTENYTSIVPGIRIYGRVVSYALSILVGIGLPLTALWLWRRKRDGLAIAPSIENLPLGRRMLALLALLVVFNVLAWDWAESRTKDELVIVFDQVSREEPTGFSYRSASYYVGIAPGIRFADMGTSVAASFFIGEILPFLLMAALSRRRQPPTLPLPPIAGAPR